MSTSLQAIRIEGGIAPATLFQRLQGGELPPESLTPAAYHLAGRETLRDSANRAWSYLTGVYNDWREAQLREPGGLDATSAATTRDRWLLPLLDQFGYGRVPVHPGPLVVDGKEFPLSHLWQQVPVHLVGPGIDLDHRHPGVAGAARAPQAMVQELVNRSEPHLWAILANGRRLRLLRDSTALAGSAYIEFDLETIFEGELFAEFLLLWMLCHQSRLEVRTIEAGTDPNPADCWLEAWRADTVKAGARALNGLRDGVERALEQLGTGFVAHPANAHIRDDLGTGKLTDRDLHRHLLRLIYRLLFLFVTEDRGVLLDPAAEVGARKRYETYLSTQRLRQTARLRHGSTAYSDLWQAQRLVLRALGGDGEPSLALPALGGLFDPEEGQEEPLLEADLANDFFLEAIRSLSWIQRGERFQPVDYRNLGAEELGSVYEALLELVPQISLEDRTFRLAHLSGNERKTTGSYYTPPALVSALLDTALDPVIDRAVASAADAAEAEHNLLALTVCDPACGSGAFLVASARRIAQRLAAVRAGDDQATPADVRHALRDVVAHCIYGVDIYPLSAELAKVSLWLEAIEPGKALGFLDAHIRVGNSLLGATPSLLKNGLPDKAFEALAGDDKKYASAVKKLNKQERGAFGSVQDQLDLDFGGGVVHSLAAARTGFADVYDDAASVRRQARQWRAYATNPDYLHRKLHADAWCAAFVWPLRPNNLSTATSERDHIAEPPTSAIVRRFETDPDSPLLAATRAQVEAIAEEYRFFHWHLEFPEIFDRAGGRAGGAGWTGGFDCMIGNPPWERVKIQEQEFFAGRDPEVATAPNAAARRKLIDALAHSDDPIERALFREWTAAHRRSVGEREMLRGSGSFPLAGRGDVNTYAVFAELFRTLTGPTGQAGIIVPTNIATDDTTKFFFRDIAESKSIAALYDFENAAPIFEGVHRSFKFCLLTMTGRDRPAEDATFAFFLHDAKDIATQAFSLAPEEITLLNPNTGTLPIFRTRRDAEITLGIYRRLPVLMNEALIAAGDPTGNPWQVELGRMFHMSEDSHLFRSREQLEADGWVLDGNVFIRPEAVRERERERERERDNRWLPLYEAKMMHQYDHRWATYQLDGTTRDVSADEKRDPSYVVMPRYWVHASELEEVLTDRPDRGWLLGWRDIARATDERTSLAGLLPRLPVGHTFPLVWAEHGDLLLAQMNSFAFDFVARQKVGGTHLTYGVLTQLPIVPPVVLDAPAPWDDAQTISNWLRARVVDLAFTTPDLAGIAPAPGQRPFPFDPERRATLRAEIDAALFHLYGVERDEILHILATFPIIRRRDESADGTFRTQKSILAAYDAMARAAASGIPYVSPLDPPAGVQPDTTKSGEVVPT
ncbi:N-6 DNA methylase [Nocardioides sp. NPDC000445]|uniref:Eco57I restriction-modification methylase domain-containing protein n=1 Tax=Nocardioides sp. NPDC000445 TaxID=3154257 RepID=UPI00333469AC